MSTKHNLWRRSLPLEVLLFAGDYIIESSKCLAGEWVLIAQVAGGLNFSRNSDHSYVSEAPWNQNTSIVVT